MASYVMLGGRQVVLPRLRVRKADGEVPLASFQRAAATDPLEAHTLAAGVSTRQYGRALDLLPADAQEERATCSRRVGGGKRSRQTTISGAARTTTVR